MWYSKASKKIDLHIEITEGQIINSLIISVVEGFANAPVFVLTASRPDVNFKSSPMPPTPKIRISTLFGSKNRVSGVRERRQWIRNAISSRIQVSMAPDQFSEAISDRFQTFFGETWISCREVFRKNRISRGSSGQSANWKMILYWSSNFHKFIKKWDLTWFLQVTFHFFMKNVFFILSHLRPVLKEFRGAP